MEKSTNMDEDAYETKISIPKLPPIYRKPIFIKDVNPNIFKHFKIKNLKQKNDNIIPIKRTNILSSKINESEKNDYHSLHDKKIYNLLKQKICIFNGEELNELDNKNINPLKRSFTIKHAKMKKKLKKIKLTDILDSNLVNLDTDNNMKTINNYKEKKNFNKNKKKNVNILNTELNHNSMDMNKHWAKHINCSLEYKFNNNKNTIKTIASLLNDLDFKIKKAFNGFKEEADDMLDKIYNE